MWQVFLIMINTCKYLKTDITFYCVHPFAWELDRLNTTINDTRSCMTLGVLQGCLAETGPDA